MNKIFRVQDIKELGYQIRLFGVHINNRKNLIGLRSTTKINLDIRRLSTVKGDDENKRLKVPKELINSIKELLRNNIWPMKSPLRKAIIEHVYDVQKDVAIRVNNTKTINNNIKIIMKEYVSSLPLAIMAIHNVLTNAGAKTPGIDNITIKTDKEKIDLLNDLSYKGLQNYKPSPVRRVTIYEPLKKKNRPLGIPTIKDRCVQELFRLVLDPAIDVISDTESYGFRKYRNCHMALGRLQASLKRNPSNMIVIDADIKSFFDTIDHNWISKNFPFPSKYEFILDSWLKAGIFENDKFVDSDTGVPQGGIISPLIANFTLNTLQTEVFKGIKTAYKGTDGKFHDLIKTLVRYADDFVIVTNHEPAVEQILSNLKNFLKERGLELNLTKTKIINYKQLKENESAAFTFLGFTFNYIKNPKISSFNNRCDLLEKEKVFIYPARNKFIAVKRKIKDIISKNLNLSAYQLIKILNPIIVGWANYFGKSVSAKTLAQLDNYIYRRLWAWLKKKYPKTSKVFLADKYFLFNDDKIRASEGLKSKGKGKRKWHFHGCLDTPNKNTLRRNKSVVLLKLATKQLKINYRGLFPR